ncbi:class I SAM-dependent rRNA methyltransferase [Streptococcus plurextorum]|uniref:class I SAM-dependent rRNA methyltransferase n=1 Tax=Streptococcus plurextorum TaxID=456876 RepID=UPI00056070E6
MMTLKLGESAEKRLKSGVQLIDSRDFLNQTFSDGLVSLINSRGDFLGTAYLSIQNKGIGWLLSRDQLSLTEGYFISLFEKAKAKRKPFEASELTTAYRLFNQDGDDLGGLTIDLYGEFALFSWYNSFIYHQKELIVAAFQKVFPDVKGAYQKIRFKGLDFESSHLYGELQEEPFTILENGVRYSVFLNDGLMTGIFLDQHEVRGRLVDGLARGKTLLNMFSYTAAFSVAAAMGGAVASVSVDLAKRSRELSQAHFEVNGLSTETHHFVVMDVFDYFKYAKRHQRTFDVIVIDPPSFARNKKQTFSVLKDYHKLIAQALEILNPKGTIIASTNASNMTAQQFRRQIEKGLGQAKYQIIDLKQLPSDFTVNKHDESSNYLKVFTIKVNQ